MKSQTAAIRVNPITPTLVALAAGVTGATSVGALQPEDLLAYKAGPVLLRPSLSLAEIYDDNIRFARDNEQDDLITVLAPGLSAMMGVPEENFAQVNYSFRRLFYWEHSDADSSNHTAELAHRLEFGRFKLSGTDSVRFLSTILSQATLEGGEIVDSGNENVDRVSYDLRHQLDVNISEKTGLYVRGEYHDIDYDRVSFYDQEVIQGTGGFQYTFSPNLDLFGEVYYGQTDVTPNEFSIRTSVPGSDFVGGFIGARGQFTPRIVGEIKAGYESREFDDETDGVGLPVAEISVTYRPSAMTEFSLSYGRRSRVSVSVPEQAYAIDRVEVEVRQMIGSSGKLYASLQGSFSNYDYEKAETATIVYPERQTQRYAARAALVYQFELWMSAGLSYEFVKVDSEPARTGIDYQVNRVTLGLDIGY